MHIDSRQQTALTALETSVASARAGFACLFSSSDEYEHALISERRAQGRYGGRYGRPSRLPAMMFAGLAFILFGAALLLA